MKNVFIFLIRLYRRMISPYLGNRCRFYPSCSQYAEQAVAERGVLEGAVLFTKRILKCHPFHPGGFDPLMQTQRNS